MSALRSLETSSTRDEFLILSPVSSSQVPRPSCVEGRENEGSKTAEFFFIGRLWKKFSWKVGKGAHNWNRQHVNSNFFSDDPSISQLTCGI